MPKNKDFAKIHIALKELGIDDDAYRDMLRLHFGVESATAINDRQMIVLLNKLRAKGWRPRKGKTVKHGRKGSRRKSDNYINIKPGPGARQQRYILALWSALGYDVEKLHRRCKKQFGVDRFEWLTDHDELHVLITDLQQRCKKAGIDPSPE